MSEQALLLSGPLRVSFRHQDSTPENAGCSSGWASGASIPNCSRAPHGETITTRFAGTGYLAPYYALLLETQLAALQGATDLRGRLETLDTALMSAPASNTFETVGNLIAAGLWADVGEPGRALASIRRRRHNDGLHPIWVTYYREEGRFATLAGDTAGARMSYERYLLLRSDAEPALQRQVDSVRLALAALDSP